MKRFLKLLPVLAVLAVSLVALTPPAHAVTRACGAHHVPISNSEGKVDVVVCVDTGNGNARAMAVFRCTRQNGTPMLCNGSVGAFRLWFNATQVNFNEIHFSNVSSVTAFGTPSDKCTSAHIHADIGGNQSYRFPSGNLYSIGGPTPVWSSGTLTSAPSVCFLSSAPQKVVGTVVMAV